MGRWSQRWRPLEISKKAGFRFKLDPDRIRQLAEGHQADVIEKRRAQAARMTAARQGQAEARKNWSRKRSKAGEGKRPNKLDTRQSAPKVAGMAGWKVLAARLEPAVWYTSREAAALVPEYASNAVWARLLVLWRKGIVERAANPEYRPYRESADPCAWAQWLYRLTEFGELEAAGWRGQIEA